jgi:hypothetical protein
LSSLPELCSQISNTLWPSPPFTKLRSRGRQVCMKRLVIQKNVNTITNFNWLAISWAIFSGVWLVTRSFIDSPIQCEHELTRVRVCSLSFGWTGVFLIRHERRTTGNSHTRPSSISKSKDTSGRWKLECW